MLVHEYKKGFVDLCRIANSGFVIESVPKMIMYLYCLYLPSCLMLFSTDNLCQRHGLSLATTTSSDPRPNVPTQRLSGWKLPTLSTDAPMKCGTNGTRCVGNEVDVIY